MQNAENRTPLREGERRGRKQNFRVETASRREVWELRRRKREKTEKRAMPKQKVAFDTPCTKVRKLSQKTSRL